jgi:hypothetical protein
VIMFEFVFIFPILEDDLLYNPTDPGKQTVKTCAPIKAKTIHNALMTRGPQTAQPHHQQDDPKLKQIEVSL